MWGTVGDVGHPSKSEIVLRIRLKKRRDGVAGAASAGWGGGARGGRKRAGGSSPSDRRLNDIYPCGRQLASQRLQYPYQCAAFQAATFSFASTLWNSERSADIGSRTAAGIPSYLPARNEPIRT